MTHSNLAFVREAPIFCDEKLKIAGEAILQELLDQAKCQTVQEMTLPFFTYQVHMDRDHLHLEIHIIASLKDYIPKFCYEMMRKWLIPGHTLNFSTFLLLDFLFEEKKFCLGHFTLSFPQKYESLFYQYIDLFQHEMCLGLISSFHAMKILEIKGMGSESKLLWIQERTLQYIKRFPTLIDYDIIPFLQSVFLSLDEEFKMQRSIKQIFKMILYLYALKKNDREERIQTQYALNQIELPLRRKSVLSVHVGIPQFSDKDYLEMKEIFSLISDYLPSVAQVEHSLFFKKEQGTPFAYLYFELENLDNEVFSSRDMEFLKQLIPMALEKSIYPFIRPVELPRNEEEQYKSLLTLSNQIQSTEDLPHVMISHFKQDLMSLRFLVCLVYPKQKGERSLISEGKYQDLIIEIEKIKNLGFLTRDFIKEGVLFSLIVHLEKESDFDPILHYMEMRKKVAQALRTFIGEFRDFSGGMLEKQMEKLDEMKQQIGPLKEKEKLLGKFFISILQKEYLAIWETPVLIAFFRLFQQSLQNIFNPSEEFYDTSYNSHRIIIRIFYSKEEYEKVQDRLKFSELSSSQYLVLGCKHLKKYIFGISYNENLIETEKIKHILCLS